MSKRIGILVVALLTFCGTASAQIVNGLDTLYGNEWIESDQQYLRLEVAADGFYRINYSDLQAQGWPVNTINSADYQIFHQGEQLPLHSTAAAGSPLTAADALVFYGTQNRGELDQHLFRDPEAQQLNPLYSLYNDQGVYYLTWKEGAGQTFTTVANDLSDLPAAEAYVWRQAEEIFTEKFVKEYYRFSGATLYYSHYSIGEGYGSRAINELLSDGSTTQEINLPLLQAYTSGPAAVVRTRYVAALFDHLQQLSANDVLLRADTFTNWAMQNVEMDLPATVLAEQELRLRWEGLAGAKDEVSVGFVQVDYPAQPDAAGANAFSCRLDNSGGRQYLELENLSASTAVVYDLANQVRIPVDNPDGTLRVGLPVVSANRELHIIPDETSLPVPVIRTANLTVPELGDANYIILTHSLLRAGSEDAVQAYADYRASATGGGYRTAIVNVDELYDQFAYGVQQHPLAIRNFVAWQEKINPAFEFLFIVGKGREYIDLRDPSDLSEALGTTLFVPPFGFPGSDNLLASRPDKPTPRINIGRLSAINPAEVILYLNKVRGTETLVGSAPQTIADRSWTKNILHLGGGGNASEQQSIRNNLEAMANTVETGLFGADVTGVYKASTDPIETSQSEFIFSRINEGVSMITFFGHSSAGTFDFSIDNPENYENYNKYPLMLSLGCYSGNMFAEFRSIGERFLLLESGGAGVYGASRGLGFIHALNSFGRYFYDRMSNDLYGATVGEGLRLSIEHFEDLTDQAFGSLMEQFSLQGDPAFRLNPAPGVDLTVDPATATFSPTVVNVQRDSFDFTFDLYNLGKVQDGEVEFQIEQELPSGERRVLYTDRTIIPHYQKRITVTLPTLGRTSVGVNRVFVTVDPNNEVAEFPNPAAENNNQLLATNGTVGIPLFVVDNTAVPIWPADFGISGSGSLTLKATSSDILASERNYLLQVDTTQDFTQPLAATSIRQIGGLIEWQPEFSWQDSTVYYWRISPQPEDGDTTLVWESSSFTFLEDISSGYSQAHYQQWEDGTLDDLRFIADGDFQFRDQPINVRIRNKIWGDDRPGLFYDNGGAAGSVRPWIFLNEGLAVVVSTPNTASFWKNPPEPGLWSPGDYGVSTGSQRVFAFPTTTVAERSNLLDFLENVVPDDYLVFIFTIYRTEDAYIHTDEWALDSLSTGTNIYQYLEGQGASEVRQLETFGTVPYIFKYKKNSNPLGEAIAPNILSETNLEVNIPLTQQEGTYRSPVFGPTATWEQFNYQVQAMEDTDTVSCTVYAGLSPGSLDSIASITLGNTGSVDLSSLGLDGLPYLQLRWEVSDFEERTTPDLSYWHLLGQPLPDIALDPNRQLAITGDSLAQGQAFNMELAVHNSSGVAVPDSFLLRYSWLQNSGGVETFESMAPPLAPGESTIWSFEIPTSEVSGRQQVILEANPANQPAETYRLNNNATVIFDLSTDEIDPVVDIAFDGIRILDGDLVSARPEVVIEIRDENELLLLDDPELFEIAVIDPTGVTQSLSIADPDIQFIGATDPADNRARMIWQPDLAIDGTYQLGVKAKDRSGNNAGRLLAEQSFEVRNEQLLSNVLPYPNPFTTSAQFVYTLSGSEDLEDVQIQILTASGRIVRTITNFELGPLKVGTHRTEYAWDGRDQYGDQLANGVYFYRVMTRNNSGASVDLYTDERRDQFFQGGLGKIVLLR